MKSAILIVFVMFFSFAGFSQGEWNNWYFGNLAGVTFNYGLPPTYLLDGQINGARAVAMASDSLGNLLFYTNGANVWNRNHMIMPNGSGLFTNYADQSVLIVKQIADDSSYYIFTTNGMNWPPPQNNDGLHYSVVNMRLNGGMGDVDISQKNIALQTTGNYPFLMTAARHKNNRDIWLITHNTHNSCVYLAYLITASGINFPPVQSPSLFNWINVVYMNAGYMRVSPDGSRLVYPFADTVEVCRFDNETGAINPKFRIQTGNHYANEGWDYLEFSVNSKYLYNSADDWTNAKIYQYNATLTDSTLFKQSETLIGESPYGVHLQMGPDFKIYGDQSGNDSLCVINNPNSGGIACNFQPDAVYLDHRICSEGLPQFLQRYLAIIADSGHCQYQLVYFTPHIWPPPDSVYWDFGDPASGGANTSNIVNATHIYNLTGSYHISLFVRHIDMRIDTTSAMITILPGVTTSLGPDQTVCEGDSVTFDAGACSNCSYIWSDITAGPFIIGYGQTFKTGDPGIYKVIVTNSNGCNATDTIQLIVNLTPSVTNDPLSKNVCSGEPENISLTSTVTGTNFYWTPTLTSGNITGFSPDSGLVINQTLINIGATPGVVTYHIIPKVGNCPGDAVDFQVTVTVSDSVKIVISASDNDVCSGTMVTFTAIPVNQGTTPQYQWKVNGINTGTNLPGFTYVPLNSDVVTCVLTSSNLICMTNNPATSTAINMVVNPNLPVSITISPSINPVCTGNSVTFTAIAIHGGAIPSFQWKVNGVNAGTDNTSYSFIPNNGDVVTCGLTSDALCATGNPATSNSVTMTVNPNLPVSVSISASANPFCQGASVTLTATPTNGGTIPSYQWKVNGLTIGTNNPVYSDSPNNGDVVFCELNSSVVCPISNPATSNTITMVENTNLPVGVSINASTNPVCSGNSVTFTAIPANGGSSPSYQWKVNGVNTGPNNPVFIYNPVNGDCISCILTSNLVCASGNPATSNSICMTVNPNLPVSITISTPITTICAGTQVTFTASPANQGTLPQYQWKVNGVGVGTSNLTYSYIPLNGDQVSCVLTSNTTCPTGNPATSNTITMTVNANMPVSVLISASNNPVCSGIPVTYTATPTNGGTTPVYLWKVNGINSGTNSPTYQYVPLNNDQISCTLTSNLTCTSGNPATSNTITMGVAASPIVTLTRCNDSITTLNAQPFRLKGGIPLGGNYSGSGVTNGIFYPAIAGVGIHQITYTYTNGALCSASAQLAVHSLQFPVFICGNSLTDPRDGKMYLTVQIGLQCWMSTNLNYGTMIPGNISQRNNCINEKYCLNDLTGNCELGTANYQWDELVAYDETLSTQGLCPPGWHVPTEADWNTLFANYISNAFAAWPLLSTGFSGFNATLSGTWHMNVTWDWNGFSTMFWSSTSHGTTKAWSHGMNDTDPSVSLYPAFRSNAFSVRCLKDN